MHEIHAYRFAVEGDARQAGGCHGDAPDGDSAVALQQPLACLDHEQFEQAGWHSPFATFPLLPSAQGGMHDMSCLRLGQVGMHACGLDGIGLRPCRARCCHEVGIDKETARTVPDEYFMTHAHKIHSMSVFYNSGAQEAVTGFHPALELVEIHEDSAIWCLAPDSAMQPGAILDLVADGVFAVSGELGEALDQDPAAGILHADLRANHGW